MRRLLLALPLSVLGAVAVPGIASAQVPAGCVENTTGATYAGSAYAYTCAVETTQSTFVDVYDTTGTTYCTKKEYAEFGTPATVTRRETTYYDSTGQAVVISGETLDVVVSPDAQSQFISCGSLKSMKFKKAHAVR